MSPLKLAWDARLTYRCFYDDEAGVAGILSSRLVADATGHSFGPIVVVTEPDGTVCDIEIRLGKTPANTASTTPATLPDHAEISFGVTRVVLRAKAKPRVGIDENWLIVTFESSPAAVWRQMGESSVFLLTRGDELLSVAVRGPELDRGGLKEARWLDELEGTDPSVAARSAVTK